MVSDSISDLLIQIKNGYLAKKPVISIPYFKLGEDLAGVLSKRGYIGEVKSDLKSKKIIVTLLYKKKRPALTGIKRVSKPGLRIYVSWNKIPKVLGGFGFSILSTSKGLMTNKEAKKSKIGGELLCQIW